MTLANQSPASMQCPLIICLNADGSSNVCLSSDACLAWTKQLSYPLALAQWHISHPLHPCDIPTSQLNLWNWFSKFWGRQDHNTDSSFGKFAEASSAWQNIKRSNCMVKCCLNNLNLWDIRQIGCFPLVFANCFQITDWKKVLQMHCRTFHQQCFSPT